MRWGAFKFGTDCGGPDFILYQIINKNFVYAFFFFLFYAYVLINFNSIHKYNKQ